MCIRDRVNTALGTLVANKVGTTTATEYWLASRHWYYSSSIYWNFGGRYVDTGGGLNFNGLCYYSSGGFGASNIGRAVRPIVTLKSGVKASSGEGSSSSPYVLP